MSMEPLGAPRGDKLMSGEPPVDSPQLQFSARSHAEALFIGDLCFQGVAREFQIVFSDFHERYLARESRKESLRNRTFVTLWALPLGCSPPPSLLWSKCYSAAKIIRLPLILYTLARIIFHGILLV